jgi:hypothetical protein
MPGVRGRPHANQAALAAKKKKRSTGPAKSLLAATDGRSGSGDAHAEAGLQPGAKEFLLYLERRGIVRVRVRVN